MHACVLRAWLFNIRWLDISGRSITSVNQSPPEVVPLWSAAKWVADSRTKVGQELPALAPGQLPQHPGLCPGCLECDPPQQLSHRREQQRQAGATAAGGNSSGRRERQQQAGAAAAGARGRRQWVCWTQQPHRQTGRSNKLMWVFTARPQLSSPDRSQSVLVVAATGGCQHSGPWSSTVLTQARVYGWLGGEGLLLKSPTHSPCRALCWIWPLGPAPLATLESPVPQGWHLPRSRASPTGCCGEHCRTAAAAARKKAGKQR